MFSRGVGMRSLVAVVLVSAAVAVGVPVGAVPGDPGEGLPIGVPHVGQNVVVSPDSRYVVFTQSSVADDDVQLQWGSMTDGSGAVLSCCRAVTNFVVTSDGQHVVFVERGSFSLGVPAKVYVAAIDGSDTVLLGDGFSFSVAPDLQTVVIRSQQGLRAVPIGGGPGIDIGPMADVPSVPTPGFVISPDSSTAAVWVWDEDTETVSLYAVALDGSESSLLAGPKPHWFRSDMTFTPDGSRVVYRRVGGANKWQLYSASLDGSGPIRLNAKLPRQGDVKDWALTPDGQTVVYRADQTKNNVQELWAVPVGGGTPLRLNNSLPSGGDVKGPSVRWFDRGPSRSRPGPPRFLISPDGLTVVYRADERVNNAYELFSVNIDGSGRNRLTGTFPTWGDVKDFTIAPDGQTVVFRADQRTNNRHELFAVPLAGGRLTLLNSSLVTRGDVKRGFAVSPDNRLVAYIADQAVDGRADAYLTALTGGRDSTLLNVPRSIFVDNPGTESDYFSHSLISEVFFSPDSAWVIFRERSRVPYRVTTN